MNFRKFISGISALTIAATAFASMAVVANAESKTAYSENFDNTDGKETTTFTFATYDEKKEYVGEEITAYKHTDYGFSNATGTAGRTIVYVQDGKLQIAASAEKASARGLETYATFDETVGFGNIAHVSYTWDTGWATGDENNSYSQTYISDSLGYKVFSIKYLGDAKQRKMIINGTKEITGVTAGTFNIVATIDLNYKKITSLTITRSGQSTVYSSDSDDSELDFENNSATSIARFGFLNQTKASTWTNTSTVDDISVTYEESKVDTVKYTLNAVLDGGEVISQIAAGDAPAGNTVPVNVKEVIFANGTYYKLADETVQKYTKNVVVSATETTDTVVYEKDDSIVYYSEAEDLPSPKNNVTSGDDITQSGAKYAHVNGDRTTDATTLDSGKYNFITAIKSDEGRNVVLRDSSIDDTYKNELAIAQESGTNTIPFELRKQTSVTVSGRSSTTDSGRHTTNQSAEFDYVIIRKTGEVEPETTHSEGFTFEKIANELSNDAKVNVVFKSDRTSNTRDYTEEFGTSFTGAGAAKIAVLITNIANGYSVQSVTIK